MNGQFDQMKEYWEIVHDCYIGTVAIKNGTRANRYLPISSREKSQWESSPDRTVTQYEFRKKYATFENIFRPTVDDMVGLMQKNPLKLAFGATSDYESPQEVRDINVYGNLHNDGLKGLKGRLNFHQVLFGRYGLLLDVITDEEGLQPKFVISEYRPQQIVDGQTGRTRSDGESSIKWVLLDESTRQFHHDTKSWERQTRLRVLGLDEQGDYYQALLSGNDASVQWEAFDLANPTGLVVYPTFHQKRLSFIPFTTCNVNTLGLDQWQEPPLLDVAHVAIGIYQIDSLYKKALWNFASPTLSIANAERSEKDFFLGDAIWPRTNGEHPVTVSLLETGGIGLAEMRQAKEEMKETLRYSSIRDLLEGAGANSSGQAIELRTVSGTATIAAIDQTSARALEEQLIFASLWAGASYSQAASRISCQADTGYLVAASQLGAIISLIGTNATADSGSPLLCKRNIYSMLEKALPHTLTDFDDNEAQKALLHPVFRENEQ